MALTATEIANSTAGKFDVELRFYGGLAYSGLTLTSYISGAIDPSTAGWTNITAYVNDAGNLTYERTGNTLKWTASISGTQYSATYFAPGQAILCLRRILVAGTQTVPSVRHVGIVVARPGDERRHVGRLQARRVLDAQHRRA